MAESSEKCLACNNIVSAGSRRVLNTKPSSVIVPCLKDFLLKKLESTESDQELEINQLDEVVSKSFVCRSCFRAYESYVAKGNKLY